MLARLKENLRLLMTQRAVHRISGNSSESPKRPDIIYHLGDQALGTLSKPRRRRQLGHGKTKDLIGRTIARHVRFKTLYIS